jgi:hypothetical protein
MSEGKQYAPQTQYMKRYCGHADTSDHAYILRHYIASLLGCIKQLEACPLDEVQKALNQRLTPDLCSKLYRFVADADHGTQRWWLVLARPDGMTRTS